MKLKVSARRALTVDIEEFTLTPVGDEKLPAACPGAHITIETPSAAHRRYSLVYSSDSPDSYTVAIKLEPKSRGGSQSMHEQATVGTVLEIEEPDNDFPLAPNHPVLLIAGGIGVTPIYSMAQRLVAEGREVRALYCTREASRTAYADEFRELLGDRLKIDHNAIFDFWELLGKPTAEHIYCCGPGPMMDEVKAISGHWPEGHVHFEEFKPIELIREGDKPFTIVLSKTGVEIEVSADLTILETLRNNGHKVISSCESGTCGTCKCSYSEGEVDHRDLCLMDEEKGDKIMVCVSRTIGDRLVLEL